MGLFAQLADDGLLEAGAAPFLGLIVWAVTGLLFAAYSLFWLWMVIQCVRSEPDWHFWIWLLIAVPFPGAIVYALTRYFPSTGTTTPRFVRRWTRKGELARLEAAAEQIGNPYQFIQWGDALRETGDWRQAEAAYQRALAKEPANLPALWGAALVAEHDGRHQDVIAVTRKILDLDPQYKFGDVSLAHGCALAEAGHVDAARDHLERHIKRWRHPESLYRLACLYHQSGQPDLARQHLQSLIQDLNSSPTAIARKHSRWKSRARQLLKKLP